jgi:hypothetical protein
MNQLPEPVEGSDSEMTKMKQTTTIETVNDTLQV